MDISKLFWSHQKNLINNLIWDSIKCSWSYIKIYPFGTWLHALNTTCEIQEKIESIDRSKAKKYSWSYSIAHLHCFCISFLEAGASPPPSSVIRFGFPLTFLQIKAPRTQQPHFRRKTVWALSSVPEDFPHIVLSDLDIWIEGFLLKIIKSSSSFSSWITPNLFRFWRIFCLGARVACWCKKVQLWLEPTVDLSHCQTDHLSSKINRVHLVHFEYFCHSVHNRRKCGSTENRTKTEARYRKEFLSRPFLGENRFWQLRGSKRRMPFY